MSTNTNRKDNRVVDIAPSTGRYVSKKSLKKRSEFYARRNRQIAAIAIILIIGAFLIGMKCGKVSQKEALISTHSISVCISKGDTIWGVASEYCPDGMDIREYIDIIKEENDIYDSNNVQAGTSISIPIFEKMGDYE